MVWFGLGGTRPAYPAAAPPSPTLQWGPNGVSVRGQLFPLVRIHFTPQTGKPGAGAPAPAAAAQ